MTIEYEKKNYVSENELKQLLLLINKDRKYTMNIEANKDHYIEKIILDKYVSGDTKITENTRGKIIR